MTGRGVIFDMDGLLIDSERAALTCWREAAAELSLGLDDTLWLSMVGLHEAGCAKLLDDLLGSAKAERLTLASKHRYDALLEQGLPLKSGVHGLLQNLSDFDVPLAVATSTRGERARIKLARSGIDHFFRHVVTSSDVTHAKPAPDLYLLAAERLGIPPSECIALEDSEFGVRAAAAAGLRVIQVPDLVAASELSRSLATVVSDLEAARPVIESWLGIPMAQSGRTVGAT